MLKTLQELIFASHIVHSVEVVRFRIINAKKAYDKAF